MEQTIDKMSAIRGNAKRLRLSCLTADVAGVLPKARQESPSYDDFLLAVLADEVLATALLDRLLYKCELLKLSGSSYRMKNRRTIFNDNKTKESK